MHKNQYFSLATIMCFLTEDIGERGGGEKENVVITEFVKILRNTGKT